ncbi:vWA domain-containing protein [Roseibium denhamense]|uniref:vWA domain-containing protein n=1 Tax=Roseibium denhamense TaxID=76305 RepID=UPI0018AD1F5B|nr:VWA domain-containing protein [Roseibium denhamense]
MSTWFAHTAITRLLALAALLSASVAALAETTVKQIDHGINVCPAFDIVQRNILEVTAGADGEEAIPQGATDPVAVEIIFDASGSMAASLDGRRKIDIARQALGAALNRLDQSDALVSIRAYGFDSSVEKSPEASCPNTALVSNFRQRGQQHHSGITNRLEPYGYTPIAASLHAAGVDLSGVRARDRMVILITDGEETCNGDPVAAAAALRARDFAVASYVVGFDLDAEQRAQMLAIASAGGGAYFDASDAASLEAAIDEAVGVTVRKQERVIKKCINDVRGGETVAEATVLGPGLFTVGELLPKQTERFYRIDTSVGQHVVLRGLLQSHRTYPGENGKPFETAYALGAFTIRPYHPDGQPMSIRAARKRNIPGTSFFLEYTDQTGSGIAFSIGDNYDWVAPDPLFAIEIDGETGISEIASTGNIRFTQNAEPDRVLQGELDKKSSDSIGGDDPIDVWRIALPSVSGNAEGWQGVVSVFTETAVSGYRLDITVAGEREGETVALADNPGGSGYLAVAAIEPEQPLDALIVTLKSKELDGAVTEYDLFVVADG